MTPSPETFARLDGRTALVTGGARGLGRAIAGRLAEAGATGAIVDLEGELAGASAPTGWLALAADVRREESIAAAIRTAVDRLQGLDIVVANAGVVPPWRETAEIDFAEWDDVFGVNVRGVIATIKHAVPALKHRGGSIVVLGSINSSRAHPRQCLYTATKHAVLGIVRSTALDLGRYGIRVNAVGPGPVATKALLGRIERRAAAGGSPVEEALRRHAAETALGRMVTEADVANTVLFLAGDLAAGLTGLIVPVEAGLG
ncbi:MAG: SDR family oxidoreductase [Methylobacteriaceae bacterium]|nr:SDR family oxidoreductase [Methylobacteriaceae bacterium]